MRSVEVATGAAGVNYDKPWITCDTTPASPHYGNCYAEWDLPTSNDQVVMSTSTDGGLTWSAPSSPAGKPHGLGGQPLVQPDGTVIVPFLTNSGAIRSFRSANGGASWSASVPVATPRVHTDAGGIRTTPLPSAQEDAAGKIYVAWQDCRFRNGCASNDIVYSTSANGTTWGSVTRVPIDPVTSTADHFLPGFRGGSRHVRDHHPDRPVLLLLSPGQLHRLHLQAGGRVHLVGRRRRLVEDAGHRGRADEAVAARPGQRRVRRRLHRQRIRRRLRPTPRSRSVSAPVSGKTYNEDYMTKLCRSYEASCI